ncbi:MAG: biopolymer transporter ExbD [Bacteroidetes bacterium]|nr:biopolymer transporter ExbD [Bacteroidota bacterium]
MSVHFKKKSAKTSQEIPTASLPDIIFMLLIFFMVTTVMRETDLLVRTSLPAAESVEKIE